MSAYDPADNSRKCYELALRAARERQIRAGVLLPDPSRPQELQWAEEGIVSSDKLEAVRD